MNTEQERADFEAWHREKYESTLYCESRWEAWQARAALQAQPTESFPCRIIEADFETGTVTVEMQGQYTVSAGQKYLCDAPLQSQDREDAVMLVVALEESRQAMKAILAKERLKAVAKRVLSRAILMADKAIDRARRIEGADDA